jgi:hypothetical protein
LTIKNEELRTKNKRTTQTNVNGRVTAVPRSSFFVLRS